MDKSEKEQEKTTTKGLPEGFTRSTLIIRDKYLEEIKIKAIRKKKKIYEVIDEYLSKIIKV